MKLNQYLLLALINLKRRKSAKINIVLMILSLSIILISSTLGSEISQYIDRNLLESMNFEH